MDADTRGRVYLFAAYTQSWYNRHGRALIPLSGTAPPASHATKEVKADGAL